MRFRVHTYINIRGKNPQISQGNAWNSILGKIKIVKQKRNKDKEELNY